MRLFMTHLPEADGGYPLGSDSDPMIDDRCLPVPDPGRWSDDDWRDSRRFRSVK